MSTPNKNIYRVLMLSSFAGLLMLILFGISQVLAYLNTGADRSSMLHVQLKKEASYLPKTIWKDTLNPGRPVESQTLQRIERDYLNAWYVRQQAYKTNNLSGMDAYYTTSALQKITTHINANKKQNITINGTAIIHELSLDFYSTDGQLAVVTDTGVKEYQRVFKNDTGILETTFVSDYQMVLLLEDGNWRIRHFIKKKHQPTAKDIVPETPGFAKVYQNNIYLNHKPYQIKGINYYPQQTPWDMFGAHFDSAIITKDFQLLKNLGLNTLRIFVSYEDFGGAKVKPAKLAKLKQVLDSAEASGLKVIVTLFDFYGDYSVQDWTRTHHHAAQIITPFKKHKAILAWDIKNEPDLDFKNRGKVQVLAWLQEMAQQLKSFDPNHLVTIGWSNLASSILLQEHLDVVSFHYYQDIDDFAKTYKTTKNQIYKPMVLQEFGLSSARGLWNPFGASEKQQAAYHQQFLDILENESLHYLSWTLYDFEEIPSAVAGSLPWRKQKQKHFGFIDIHGNHKEALEFISK